MNTYTPVIGLEVHVELKTHSKMFCGCSADYFGKEPNTHTCPVCLGLPGALPVPNQKAIEWCIKIALALNCTINEFSKFDRKNYFYPDLAKGFQISQYDLPFGENGWIDLESPVILASDKGARPESHHTKKQGDAGQASMTKKKRIRIRRVHMEEDTGKLSHEFQMSNFKSQISNGESSFIDFNRSGVPLVEIVTEPDFDNAGDVKEYLQKLQQIVRYLDVSNADMEKGDMRLEPNISLSSSPLLLGEVRSDDNLPNYKVEVKNINSFRFVEKAIQFEIKRQTEILDKGETPKQETRGWNEGKNQTFSQRSKEEAQDYRYFPEPDIPPIRLTKFQISDFKSQIPELPDAKSKRFQQEFSLPKPDAEILIREKEVANYFEEAIKEGKKQDIKPKQIANTIINKKIDTTSVSIKQLLTMIKASSQTVAIDEQKLTACINEVLQENQKAVEDYRSGKETVIMFLLGTVMRKLAIKADPQMIKSSLEKTLKSL